MNLAAHQCWHDFLGRLNEMMVLSSLAGIGLGRVIKEMDASPRDPTNPDPNLIVGHGPPAAADTLVIGSLRLSRLVDLNRGPNSLADTMAMHQLIAFIYALWNDEYRPRLAKLLGLPKPTHLRSDVMGDLRRLRHDIVHHGGVATREWSGRVTLSAVKEVVEVGQPLSLTSEWLVRLLASLTIEIMPIESVE